MPIFESISTAVKVQLDTLKKVSLDKECEKAAKILEDFVFDEKNQIIKPKTISKAKGLAILTIGKAGISFTVRSGNGILISRLPDDSWSAPVAIKTQGYGIGNQVGAEIVELIMVLTTEDAVKNFCDNNNLSVGGNISATIANVGRTADINSNIKNASTIISYGKSKGYYFGWSLEGNVIQQNNESNNKAYNQEVAVKDVLSGAIPPPDFAMPLYDVLIKIDDTVNKENDNDDSDSVDSVDSIYDIKDDVKEEEKNEEDEDLLLDDRIISVQF